MPCCQSLRSQADRQRGQVGKLYRLVTADTRHRRFAAGITVGEIRDNRPGEALLGIDDVMPDAEPIGDAPGIVNVLSGAAGAFARRGGTMVIKLERDTDDLMPSLVKQTSDNAAVHAAGH